MRWMARVMIEVGTLNLTLILRRRRQVIEVLDIEDGPGTN